MSIDMKPPRARSSARPSERTSERSSERKPARSSPYSSVHSPAGSSARKSGGGTLLGLFIGLVVGVIAVAGVVWYINKVPLPFTTNGQQPKLTAPLTGKTTPEVPPLAAVAPAPLPGKPGDPTAPDKPRFDFYKILPGNVDAIPDPKPEEVKPIEVKPAISKHPEPSEAKSGEAKPAEPKASEAKSPEVKAAEAKAAELKAAEAKAAKAAEAKAKAEKNEKSAEKSEATLKEPIFLQAGSFQSASEADNQKARLALLGAEARIQQVMLQDKVWYRVRLGPFNKMDEVNHLRADLAKQGVDANLVRKD